MLLRLLKLLRAHLLSKEQNFLTSGSENVFLPQSFLSREVSGQIIRASLFSKAGEMLQANRAAQQFLFLPPRAGERGLLAHRYAVIFHPGDTCVLQEFYITRPHHPPSI